MSTADKLNKLLETKEAIKQAIIDKGGAVGDVFADYPTAIQNIQSGSGKFVVPGWVRFAHSKNMQFPEGKWDWSEIEKETDLPHLFYNCTSLKIVPKLKLSKLEVANCMFQNCSSLEDLDVAEWNTSELRSADYMFSSTKIRKLPQINTSQVKSMPWMFNSCSNLTEANLDTSSTTDMTGLFSSCSNLRIVSELDASKVTSSLSSYSSPFNNCYLLRYFGGFKGLKVNMYLDKCYSLSYESLMNVINKLEDGVSGKTLYLTQDCVNQLSDDDIAIATNKGWSVSPARTITELVIVSALNQIPSKTYQITSKRYDFSQFDGVWGTSSGSSLTNKNYMYVFEGDLSNTTDASYMFKNCVNLTYVTLTNTRNIVNMTGMFWGTPITTAPELDTSSVIDMSDMFYDTDITNIPNYITSNVTDMSNMFYQCVNLKTADLSEWDLSKVEDVSNMFAMCPNLTSIKMTGDVSNITEASNFVSYSTSGTFYYNPAYDYSKIIALLPPTWTAVPLTE